MANASRIEELQRQNAELSSELDAVKQQLEWFKRQLFGRKSEKRLDVDPAVQGNLLAQLGVAHPPPPKDDPVETITYQRRKKQRDGAVNDSGLRFGEDVPREIIAIRDPEIKAIPADRRELIGTKVSYRLAQRPGSYVVIEYTRPVYNLLDEDRIVTTPAPANVLDKSVAGVSFLAGMLIDKFCYHRVLRMRPSRNDGSNALLKMRVGPSESACRSWLQTTTSCER